MLLTRVVLLLGHTHNETNNKVIWDVCIHCCCSACLSLFQQAVTLCGWLVFWKLSVTARGKKKNVDSFVSILCCSSDESFLPEYPHIVFSFSPTKFCSLFLLSLLTPSWSAPCHRPGDDWSDHRLQEGGDKPWQRGHPHRCQSGGFDHPVPAGRSQQHALSVYRWVQTVMEKMSQTLALIYDTLLCTWIYFFPQ